MRTLSDTRLVYVRSLRQTCKDPTFTFIALGQPLLFLFLFGPLLKPVIHPAAGQSTWDVFVPGLLVQLALFGTAFVGFTLIDEVRNGVIERLRVTPISRLALLLGRAGRDATVLAAQTGILLLVAWPLGLHFHPALLLALPLLLALGVGISAFSYTMALVLNAEEPLAAMLNGLTLPLMLLSGILLPLSLAPRWLGDAANLNPLRHTVDAVRALAAGHVGQQVVLRGALVTVGLAVVLIVAGVRRFERDAA